MGGILVISFYFADLLGGAVRTNKFLKFWLRQNDCSVRVITAEKAGVGRDHQLLEELRGDLKIAGTAWIDYMGWQARARRRFAWLLPSSLHYDPPGLAPAAPSGPERAPDRLRVLPRRVFHYLSDFLCVPDAHWGWIPFALFHGLRWSRECEVLYSTSPPETGHIAALLLKRWTGKPWVADFRDPWINNSFREARHESLRRWNQRCEAAVVRSADRILCNTDRMRADFLARYPGVDPAKFITVWNGFDEEDFAGLPPAPRRDGRLLILHTGSFYGLRTPIPFLRALGQLKERGLIQDRDLSVEFIGTCSPAVAGDLERTVTQYGLGPLVTLTPPRPYRETLARQMSADLLLLVGHAEEGTSMQIPGKAFEYIRTGKPVLYLFPGQSATADLFERLHTGQALRADPDHVGSIGLALQILLTQIKSGARMASAPSVEYLRRSNQAHQVLHILRGLMRHPTPLLGKGMADSKTR